MAGQVPLQKLPSIHVMTYQLAGWSGADDDDRSKHMKQNMTLVLDQNYKYCTTTTTHSLPASQSVSADLTTKFIFFRIVVSGAFSQPKMLGCSFHFGFVCGICDSFNSTCRKTTKNSFVFRE